MAFLRSRSCNLTLMGSISHILCRYPIPLLFHNSPLAARALIRHYNSPYRFKKSYSHEPEKLTNFGISVVPQQKAYVIERLGKYRKTLFGGIHFSIPVVDRIAYVLSLKEESFLINNRITTHGKIIFLIEGIVSVRVVDPYLASYELKNPILKIPQLAQTAVSKELGTMGMFSMIKEFNKFNEKIVSIINEAAAGWGVRCTNYEIMDITPPPSMLYTITILVEEAERRRHANILEAERRRHAKILEAEGGARGDLQRARATAAGLNIVSDDMKASGGPEAASLTIAEQCGVAIEAPRRWPEFGFHIRDP